MPSSRVSFFLFLITSLLAGALSGAAAFVFAPIWTPYVARHAPAIRPWIEQRRASTTSPSLPEKIPLPVFKGEDDLVQTVARTSQAVVSIRITKEVAVSRHLEPGLFGDLFDDPLVPLRRDSSHPDAPSRKERREVGGGSGFFVSADGLVVTNRHVVSDKEAEYTVVTQDQKTYPAKVLAVDPVLDLAILKVEIQQAPFLSFGDSDALRIGQTVIAIGNTLDEFQNTVTKGVVSGLNRRVVAGGSALNAEVIESAIQTDAAINLGNSGGPLIDLDGNVIGVNTAVSQDAQSLGFALPINVVKRAVQSVQAHGRIVRAWLGVRFLLVDEDLAKKNHLAYSYGALILRGDTARDLAVVPGSPADKAGLSENDIVLELNGTKLEGIHTLSSLIEHYAPGDVVHLKVAHEGKEKIVDITLEERPTNE